MFVIGSGLGLLASQLGNVNMSAVSEKQSGEAGGLQGTFQNLGSSVGTALVGSLMIASLTSGFVTNVATSTLPDSVKDYVQEKSVAGVSIVPQSSVTAYAEEQGLSTSEAEQISDAYAGAQIRSLEYSMLFVSLLALAALPLAKNIPDKKLAQ